MAAVAIERELKYRLTKTEYLRLKKALKQFPQKVQHQSNYFFDDPNFILDKNKIGLRLRKVNGQKAILSVKKSPTKQSSIRGYSVKTEIDSLLSAAQVRALLKHPKTILQLRHAPIVFLKKTVPAAKLQGLRRLGCMKTKRMKIPYKNFLIELDAVSMFTDRFYELEVETTKPKQVQKQLKALFEEINIQPRPGDKSKLNRFLRLYRQRQKEVTIK